MRATFVLFAALLLSGCLAMSHSGPEVGVRPEVRVVVENHSWCDLTLYHESMRVGRVHSQGREVIYLRREGRTDLWARPFGACRFRYLAFGQFYTRFGDSWDAHIVNDLPSVVVTPSVR